MLSSRARGRHYPNPGARAWPCVQQYDESKEVPHGHLSLHLPLQEEGMETRIKDPERPMRGKELGMGEWGFRVRRRDGVRKGRRSLPRCQSG